ncbi:MAG: MMPL family transporter [Candidatus Acidiferrales bacterium]
MTEKKHRRKLEHSGGSWRHWLFLTLTVVLLGLVVTFVDLKPHVDENFFFSSNDPRAQESDKIDRIFGGDSQLILAVAAPDISSPTYLERLGHLTQQLSSVPSVDSVQSLADGPKNFKDAEMSPFWTRLLIAENGRSSNVVMFVSNRDPQELTNRMEAIVAKFDAKDFRIEIAGAPYVSEMIRRNLLHDFRVFSLTAFLLFGGVMLALFRSLKLTLGMLVTCTNAVLVTLLIQAAFGQKIGVLTANLGTIVFVIALSHLVYMTFNWRTLGRGQTDSSHLGSQARHMTLPASFWSMVCASLGFASLLIVPAKPLKELGIGGTLGAVVAFACAYLMYPAFLDWASAAQKGAHRRGTDRQFWQRRFVWVCVLAILASAGLSLGLRRLNTDPSLLDYFKKGKEPREGLSYVDRNGGSNPLTIVVAAADGGRLDNKDEYEKMWDLQDALEEHKGVGTVISLPVLMAEGHRRPLAFLLSWNHLLNIMNEPKYNRVASTFVTKDRSMAAFYLRMDEHGRDQPRVDVVNELRSVVRQNGFRPVLVGGVYELQGELAQLVASSLVKGLLGLMIFFSVVAWIVGRSVRTGAAMIFSLSLVPVCMLGGIGLLKIPVDIISAPATNVCIGMAIDSMVHLVFSVRRAQAAGQHGWAAWVKGRQEQWRGIVFSDVVIGAGFAIFALSSFPPTQRFGLVVLAGTVVDILANLFVLPVLAGAEFGKPLAVAK